MSAAERYERLQELLVQRATEGAAGAEHAEVETLLREFSNVQPDDWELVAARTELELCAGEVVDPLPAALRGALHASAHAEAGRVAAPRRRAPVAPWALAAAAGLAALYFAARPLATPLAPDPAEARRALLAAEADTLRLDWTTTEDPAAAGGVGGDVVWSARAQHGFMRFAGLAANDPSVEQYQLWIFDAERPEATPVDGGVFDVPTGVPEVVVPIDAKLAVGRPALFAVTVEIPGGVVVSERSRIAVLASVPE